MVLSWINCTFIEACVKFRFASSEMKCKSISIPLLGHTDIISILQWFGECIYSAWPRCKISSHMLYECNQHFAKLFYANNISIICLLDSIWTSIIHTYTFCILMLRRIFIVCDSVSFWVNYLETLSHSQMIDRQILICRNIPSYLRL